MRFSVERENLVRATSHMSGIAAARGPVPILSNLLLEASSDRLTVTANNLDMTISVSVPAKVAEMGATTVEFHRLKSIAETASPGAEVTVSSTEEGGRAEIRAGRARHKLLTLPASDFPKFKAPDSPTRFTLRGAEMEKLLSVAYATPAEDKTRFYLEGVFLHRKEHGLAGVATDGHRLAFAEVPLPDDLDDVDVMSVIVPNEAVKILRGLASDDLAVFEVDREKIAVTFDRGGLSIRFASKLVEATYPDYGRVIPQLKAGRLLVTTEAIALAVKRAMIAQDAKTSALKVTVAEGRVSFAARSDAGTEATDEVDCDWTGDAHEFGINGRYLLASIGGLGTKELQIAINRDGGPIRLETPGDEGRFDIIMPVRI